MFFRITIRHALKVHFKVFLLKNILLKMFSLKVFLGESPIKCFLKKKKKILLIILNTISDFSDLKKRFLNFTKYLI